MSCKVIFEQKEYDKKKFVSGVAKKAKEANMNVNLRADRSTLSLMKEDDLVDFTDPTKFGQLSTTGSQSIHKRILKAVAEDGLAGLDELSTKSFKSLKENPSLTISKDDLDNIETNTKARDYVLQGVVDKLSMTTAEMADAAGVTEAEMEAYAEGDDISDDAVEKIEAYNKDKFTGAELKYYLAIRKLLKLSFPLAQRSGKILSEDGFFADAEGLEDNFVTTAEKTDERWTKVWGKRGAAIRNGLKKYSSIVSTDNILMKMGFAKGSSIFQVLYNALDTALRNSQAENTLQHRTMNDLLKNKEVAKGTKHKTRNSYNDVQKEELTFAENEKVEMSIAEILTTYLTLKQKRTGERFIYNSADYAKEKAEGKEPTKIRIREYGDRKEKRVVVTDETYARIKEIAENPLYAETLTTIRDIMNKQYDKVSDTLFILSGQKLADIPDYFPTTQASSNVSAFEARQAALEDLASTKERKDGINVLDIQDVFSLMENYIDSTNYYAYMAVPLRNANTVFYSKGVQEYLKGSNFEHLGTLYADWLKGQESNKSQMEYGDADKFVNKAYRAFYKGVLGWNVGVVLKQPTSALHAWNFFGDIKYAKVILTAYRYGFTSQKKILAEIKKYNPIIEMYSNNLVSGEVGGLISTEGKIDLEGKGVLGGAKAIGDAYINNSMKPIQRFDLASRIGLWEASKQYVTDKFGMTEAKDGISYWDKVADMHNQISEDTQQTFDVFHRSKLGRSQSVLIRGMIMFTTQLQKHMSLLDKAVTNYTLYGRKEDRDLLIRTALSVLVVQSAMVALIDMGKDSLLGFDDDDEDKFKNLMARTLANDIATVPFMQIFANDITNALMDTDLFTRPASTPLLDFFQAGQRAIGDASDDDGLGDLFETTWKEGSKMFGVPLAPFKQFESYRENKSKE